MVKKAAQIEETIGDLTQPQSIQMIPGKIGIAVNTYNRNHQCRQTLQYIRKYAPKDAVIVVVDDASVTPFRDATYRFKRNVGAPVAKNKSLELLYDAGCEHLFLFDDDTYPKVSNWWQPYVESPFPHLCYSFKHRREALDDKHNSFEWPNGCMMYIHRKVLDKVGGFDTEFKKYGHWHGSFSRRVYNAGLTPAPFLDVIGSDNLFVSLDKLRRIRSATPNQQKYLVPNKELFYKKFDSAEYCEFRMGPDVVYPKVHYSNPYAADKNIGKALNEFCAMVPDGDWICLQDGDMMYLTPDWGKQIAEAILHHGDKYALIGCMTNRLARPLQRHNGQFNEDHDIRNHYNIAVELKEKHWAEIQDVTSKGLIAGLFMLFPKATWNNVKFSEDNPAFDDQFSKDVLRRRGKLGLLKGLYVYHLYRIWSEKPIGDREHLLI